MKRLLIIDSNALVHRGYHALPPSLTTPKGEPINAVYGFTAVLLKVLKELKPEYVVATFDLAKPTFRHKQYEEYKANRPRTPDELIKQFPIVKKVVKAFNIPIFQKEGFEADDLIGTIAEKTSKNIENLIVTGDLDALQLIKNNTKVYTLKKGINDTIIYDRDAVIKRYQLTPEQLADYRGLKGDPSDNIPGVPGVGEKITTDLLKKFGSIENLYKQLEKDKVQIVSERIKKRLLENKEQAMFSKELAIIKTDVNIDFDLKKCKTKDYDSQQVIKLFRKLGFKTLINRLPKKEEKVQKSIEFSQKKSEKSEIEKAYKEKILSKEIYKLEKELIPVFKKMEQEGIKLDIDLLKDFSKEIQSQIRKLEKKIYAIAEIKFNINSSQQLSEILFDKIKISIAGLRKTPGGVVSTAASELYKVVEKHEIIELILRYRELVKIKTTYVDALPKLVNSDNRVHTSYHQLGTTTGRISSSDPNLQNIPARGEWGKKIRKAFIAKSGFKLISADYSQIELRVVACLSNDQKMIEAFKNNQDIHKITAAEVNNIPIAKVTPDLRYQAKALNFGVLYGMSISGFAEAANISRTEAKKFIEEYIRDFFGIAQYIEKTKEKAKKKGYVETILGRRRYLLEINSSDFRVRQASERMATNMPIQGTAADIIKVAMVELKKKLPKQAKILLQVHDELILEVEKDKTKEITEIVKDVMENVLNSPIFQKVRSKFCIPFEVDIKIGDNWGSMVRLNEES